MQVSLSSTIASMDIKPQHKEFDLKNDEFHTLQELGQGNGGSVMKVQHVATGTVMAKKVRLFQPCQLIARLPPAHTGLQIVLIDAKPSERKKILLELQIMHDCDSPYMSVLSLTSPPLRD
jgi:mitogen-activated protein kinase kinase